MTVRMSGTVLAVMTPALAFAHGGTDPVGSAWMSGLVEGWLHPFTGFDHWLAMLALGLWAGQQAGGRLALWLPAVFVACMVAGGVSGVAGTGVPVEAGIVTSVIVLGAAVAAALSLQRGFLVTVAVTAAAVFAFMHGAAHGLEMPATAVYGAYATGFASATLALHLAGVGIAVGLRRAGWGSFTRMGGAAVALTGAMLLVQ